MLNKSQFLYYIHIFIFRHPNFELLIHMSSNILNCLFWLNYWQDELIRARGYPVEVHKVTTRDGYILSLYRIFGPRNTLEQSHINSTVNLISEDSIIMKRTYPKRVVLLQHCNQCSPYDFILNDPDQALGIIFNFIAITHLGRTRLLIPVIYLVNSLHIIYIETKN